jgi:hypothetical protein
LIGAGRRDFGDVDRLAQLCVGNREVLKLIVGARIEKKLRERGRVDGWAGLDKTIGHGEISFAADMAPQYHHINSDNSE